MNSLPNLDRSATPKSQVAPAGGEATFAFVSLGCPKNLVDSERMLGLLTLDGYRLVENPQGADFVVINTCGFIEQARSESSAVIEEMLDLKAKGGTGGVIVAGCMAERSGPQLLDRYPEIDHVVGVFGREQIAEAANRMLAGMDEQRTIFQPAPIRAWTDESRLRITPRHFAYMKISEGCDRLCTFCAIPKMRGRHQSKPMEAIVAEAERLAADGVRELNIVAQDTTFYGIDLYGEPKLAELLRKLDKVNGLDWIRLLYFYPMYIDDKLIETIASAKHILPYIDMPLQHINDNMLRRMARRVGREQTEQLITRLRRGIPRLALRTTFITGFPGETEEQFEELADFVAEQRFERCGVFTYSYEPDTPAAKLGDQLPEEVKNERRDRLMAVQQEVAFRRAERQVGRRMDVLLDRPEGEKDMWIGRTAADAPDIDAVVYVSGKKLSQGDLVRCEIAAADGYDLIAAAVGKPKRRKVKARRKNPADPFTILT